MAQNRQKLAHKPFGIFYGFMAQNRKTVKRKNIAQKNRKTVKTVKRKTVKVPALFHIIKQYFTVPFTWGQGMGEAAVASVATLAATAVRAGKVGVDEVAAEGDRRDGRAAEEDGGLSGERGEGEHLGRELERWRRGMRELVQATMENGACESAE